MKRSTIALALLLIFLLSGWWYWFSASPNTSSTSSDPGLELRPAPNFVADSAYAHIAKQLDFGPRVPGSPGHKKCKDWLVQTLKGYGWEVEVQTFTGSLLDNRSVRGYNLIARYQPSLGKRILLAAHWDSRQVADKDSVRKDQPIPAANDGASGPAVLLEIARQLAQAKQKPNVGVDLVFFDVEDAGSTLDPTGKSWAQGSQYWASHLQPAGYRAYYGILLDMVGARDASFLQEGSSMMYAPGIVRNIWSIGQALGYGAYFRDESGIGITDDHTAVNELAKIQMIDIIDLKNNGSGFGAYHHTHQDNLAIIDKQTLKAVGQTVLQVLYQE